MIEYPSTLVGIRYQICFAKASSQEQSIALCRRSNAIRFFFSRTTHLSDLESVVLINALSGSSVACIGKDSRILNNSLKDDFVLSCLFSV